MGTALPLAFRRIVVIGGGCYGSWYTQQLTRAAQRGALSVQDIVVVDRDPHCRVATQLDQQHYTGAPVRVVVSTWDEYLAIWLAEGAPALAADAMVPSPLMPHLCLDWLIARARLRWPGRGMEVVPLPSVPPTPWERAAPDNRHYVSFATWTCPVNCIEPAKCPATRGPRDWSMPVAIGRMADREPTLHGTAIFHCTHRTYGVGMIDAAAIARADEQLAQWGSDGPSRVLVGTVSHCHGALGVLELS
ncbi:hypothetical protein GEMMAAP_10330 [Gemmatimonas phototrophica]|uniref:Uncharacterized protein n=1 Tax=Gemmatimonas phototrophica TaxID=1379270 RepID=A0A143BKT4_9BACT|nr:hypothetical protein GEMMAAP_10330 [Gemmatimonas phototrophica]